MWQLLLRRRMTVTPMLSWVCQILRCRKQGPNYRYVCVRATCCLCYQHLSPHFRYRPGAMLVRKRFSLRRICRIQQEYIWFSILHSYMENTHISKINSIHRSILMRSVKRCMVCLCQFLQYIGPQQGYRWC
jgi:hypothetical protein